MHGWAFAPARPRPRHDYARMLLVTRSSRRSRRADELLDSALTTYRQLGIDSYARSASIFGQIEPGH